MFESLLYPLFPLFSAERIGKTRVVTEIIAC